MTHDAYDTPPVSPLRAGAYAVIPEVCHMRHGNAFQQVRAIGAK